MAAIWPHRLLMGFLTVGLTAIGALLVYQAYPRFFPKSAKTKKLSALPDLGLEILPRQKWLAQEQTEPVEPLGKPTRITIHHQGGVVFLKEDLRATIEEIR